MSDDGIAVRLVKPGDVADLQAHCFGSNTVEQVRAEVEENLREYAAGRRRVPLVAGEDGQAVGSVFLLRNMHILSRHRGELCALVVCELYHGRGLARRLVDGVRDHARQLGITQLEVSCRAGTSAEAVYRRLGFQEYGRLPRGLIEPWGERQVFDQVFLWRPVEPNPENETGEAT